MGWAVWVVYLGLSPGILSADWFCVFVLLVVWVKCPALDVINSWVLPDFVHECRPSWKLSVINTPGVWSSLAVWDPGLNAPISVVQAQSLDGGPRLHKLLVCYGIQFSSVAQSCPTLCDPMNRSTPGLPVHHQLPEFTQTHVHRVIDAIQPSHPMSSPFPPAPNPCHHQSLFQWVNSLHEVAKVLEFQLQHQSLHRNPRADLLQDGIKGD